MSKEKTDLLFLLEETHEQMMKMVTWLERLQPVKLDMFEEPVTVDVTDVEEMMKTKLFRLDNEMVDEDQTSRSILKDLRKYINHLKE
jgi:hypothetical protein|tara:strand:- start:1825 stop:2085 length:261 start_codon:yes stop_codon:yes gene_type:complete